MAPCECRSLPVNQMELRTVAARLRLLLSSKAGRSTQTVQAVEQHSNTTSTSTILVLSLSCSSVNVNIHFRSDHHLHIPFHRLISPLLSAPSSRSSLSFGSSSPVFLSPSFFHCQSDHFFGVSVSPVFPNLSFLSPFPFIVF